MKKFLKRLLIVVVIVGAVYLAARILLAKTGYNSFYLIPEDAAFIIETDDPFEAWDNIVHSGAWERLSKIEVLEEINAEILSADSLISSKRMLFKLLGSRKTLISAHKIKKDKYDYLIVVNLGKLSKLSKGKDYLSRILGDDYTLTSREYEGEVILELLDEESGEFYIISVVNNHLVLSTSYILVEKSIDASNTMVLGRDIDFLNVAKRVSGSGLFNVYFNYKYFPSYIEAAMGKSNKGVSSLSNSLMYTGLSFDMDEEGSLLIEGYSNMNDSIHTFFHSIHESGESGLESAEIIPVRAASVVKIGFSDIQEYFNSLMQTLDEEEQKSYFETLEKTEKKLKISLEENLFSWIDDEIILLQTRPSNLGRNNEFALILKGKNRRLPAKNMEFISKQIKKNTPVKFREIEYNGYTISYLSFPGILKALFGKLIKKLEKPYYTVIDNYVVFSNHPQTLKNIIDDFINGNTLDYSDNFNEFSKNFGKNSNSFVYLNLPVLFDNLKEFVDAENWQKLQKNKNNLICYSNIGIEITAKDDLLKLKIHGEFNEDAEAYKKENYTVDSDQMGENSNGSVKDNEEDFEIPYIIIHDLDIGKQDEFYDDGTLKLTVGLKKGIKHGQIKLFYPDGSLKIKGKYKDDEKDGTWEYYNSEGELVKKEEYSEGKLIE